MAYCAINGLLLLTAIVLDRLLALRVAAALRRMRSARRVRAVGEAGGEATSTPARERARQEANEPGARDKVSEQ
jgi:hypothetical protein